MRPDDQTIDEAARALRASLETMLERLPEDDPSSMQVRIREQGRQRWRRSKVGGSRPRQTSARTTSRKEDAGTDPAMGKTAAPSNLEVDWSSVGVWLDLGQDRARDDD